MKHFGETKHFGGTKHYGSFKVLAWGVFWFHFAKKTLENSDPRHIFPSFSVWPLNKKNNPKQYLPRSVRVIEWNRAKVTSFYHSKMKALKHKINPKQLCALLCCWLLKKIQKEWCNDTCDEFWNMTYVSRTQRWWRLSFPLSFAFSP